MTGTGTGTLTARLTPTETLQMLPQATPGVVNFPRSYQYGKSGVVHNVITKEEDGWLIYREWYNERIITTFANAPIIDLAGHLIPTEAMLEAMEWYMTRGLGLYCYFHDELPIGQVLAWRLVDGKIELKIGIHNEFPVHKFIWDEIKQYGTDGASSIALEILSQKKECDEDNCWTVLDKIGLFSISWVADMPCNPEARVTGVSEAKGGMRDYWQKQARKVSELYELFQVMYLDGLVSKTVIPFKKYPTTDGSWSAKSARDKLLKWAKDENGDVDWKKYARGFAWYDGGKPTVAGSYKLPHHVISNGEIRSHKKGVQAAMAALLGARGGTRMPKRERQGVYNHLVKEYKLHALTPPDFKMHQAGSSFVGLVDMVMQMWETVSVVENIKTGHSSLPTKIAEIERAILKLDSKSTNGLTERLLRPTTELASMSPPKAASEGDAEVCDCTGSSEAAETTDVLEATGTAEAAKVVEPGVDSPESAEAATELSITEKILEELTDIKESFSGIEKRLQLLEDSFSQNEAKGVVEATEAAAAPAASPPEQAPEEKDRPDLATLIAQMEEQGLVISHKGRKTPGGDQPHEGQPSGDPLVNKLVNFNPADPGLTMDELHEANRRLTKQRSP